MQVEGVKSRNILITCKNIKAYAGFAAMLASPRTYLAANDMTGNDGYYIESDDVRKGQVTKYKPNAKIHHD